MKAGLLCTLVIFNLVVCKKLSMPDLNAINSKKRDECQRCKVLVESFNHWTVKTSRGKFEGGDAAWEESKLKSYARSEIRLVEIQEGLCSELKKHQDQCYNIAEEAEQALEKWWFNEDPSSVDLHSWLCIETFKYCCPQNHFGENCEPCLFDKNNQQCGGHGKCDGEETRKGSGECVCHRGYAGNHCEECAKNFYREGSGECKPCHKACNGCTAEEATDCTACASGWLMEADTCVDVNECNYLDACKSNQYCINKEGSHSCKMCDKSCKSCKGPGASNCTSCEPGSVLWSSMCVDSELREELLSDTFRRMALYFGLLFITLFIYRTSSSLTSIVIIIIAIYMFFSEKSSKINIVAVISNLYL